MAAQSAVPGIAHIVMRCYDETAIYPPEWRDTMQTQDAIIQYLKDTYHPEGIIAYGSFADGSAGEHSDFDALVIADGVKKHDSSVIGGTVLDVFVYPAETFRESYDPEEFVQIFDGRILLDDHGIAAALKARVREWIEQTPLKTEEEIREEIDWCKKMLARSSRGDAEGNYRWHWVLCDSLEIYCDAKRQHYFGPKKALRRMAENDPEAFRLYSLALKNMDSDALAQWIACLEGIKKPLPDEKGI